MSTYDHHTYLYQPKFFSGYYNAIHDIWGDELDDTVTQSGNMLTITYTRLTSLPAYYSISDPEDSALVPLNLGIPDHLALWEDIERILAGSSAGSGYEA